MDNSYDSVLDTSGAFVGSATRFITNIMPEMHEEGYTKYQSKYQIAPIYSNIYRKVF